MEDQYSSAMPSKIYSNFEEKFVNILLIEMVFVTKEWQYRK